MNDPRHDHDLPAALRMQLRTLRTPEPPARELWPDIAARLPSQPRAAAEPAPRRRPRLLPALSAAAVLALALGLGWQLRPSSPEPAQAPSLAAAPAPAQGAPRPLGLIHTPHDDGTRLRPGPVVVRVAVPRPGA